MDFIDYNITTSNDAYDFVLKVLRMTGEQLVMEYFVECNKDLDLFWERNFERLIDFNINNVRFFAFHITSNFDNCRELLQDGIRNLQYVLSHNTEMTKMLDERGVQFDIIRRVLIVNGIEYNIDYDYYAHNRARTFYDKRLESIAHRVYYDLCVDGFMANDNIRDYGVDLCKRPEFIYTLAQFVPKVKELETYWTAMSKAYKVEFYATYDQINNITFNVDRYCCENIEEQFVKVKKWMLINAVDKAFDPVGEIYLYIKDDMFIPATQILCCEEVE